ncbi:hypothetical protein H311_03252 [Anncaliia algerae PRA109]|nr:hypothetical protein H311_03252 [Anncaliia algerae PRA109]
MIFLDYTGFNAHTKRSYAYAFGTSSAYTIILGNNGTYIILMCDIYSTGLIALENKKGANNPDGFMELFLLI